MVFADGFWEVKSFYDLCSFLGIPLSLFAIWLSWLLARRDIARRIAAAQEETITRLAATLLQSDVTETVKALEQGRDFCRAREWARGIDRFEQAMRRVPRFRSLPGLAEGDRSLLDEAVDQLRLMIRYVEQIQDPKKKPESLSAEKSNQLDNLIVLISTIEGRLRAAGLRS